VKVLYLWIGQTCKCLLKDATYNLIWFCWQYSVSVFTTYTNQICRSYCQRIRNGACKIVWEDFLTLTTIQKISLPDCDTLPEAIGGTSPECFIPFNSTDRRTDSAAYPTSKNLKHSKHAVIHRIVHVYSSHVDYI